MSIWDATARQIIDDAFERDYEDAMELIAARLALIHHQGKIDGVAEVSAAFKKDFERVS